MSELEYKVIRSKTQYKESNNVFKELLFSDTKSRPAMEEIALITLPVEMWGTNHNSLDEFNPFQIFRCLIVIEEHGIKSKDLVEIFRQFN